jgi:hypothetical protein
MTNSQWSLISKTINQLHDSTAQRRLVGARIRRSCVHFFCIFRSRKYAGQVRDRFSFCSFPNSRSDRLSIGRNNVAKVARLRHFSTGTNRRERAFNKASRVAITKADSNGPPVFFFFFVFFAVLANSNTILKNVLFFFFLFFVFCFLLHVCCAP